MVSQLGEQSENAENTKLSKSFWRKWWTPTKMAMKLYVRNKEARAKILSHVTQSCGVLISPLSHHEHSVEDENQERIKMQQQLEMNRVSVELKTVLKTFRLVRKICFCNCSCCSCCSCCRACSFLSLALRDSEVVRKQTTASLR